MRRRLERLAEERKTTLSGAVRFAVLEATRDYRGIPVEGGTAAAVSEAARTGSVPAMRELMRSYERATTEFRLARRSGRGRPCASDCRGSRCGAAARVRPDHGRPGHHSRRPDRQVREGYRGRAAEVGRPCPRGLRDQDDRAARVRGPIRHKTNGTRGRGRSTTRRPGGATTTLACWWTSPRSRWRPPRPRPASTRYAATAKPRRPSVPTRPHRLSLSRSPVSAAGGSSV